MKNSQKGFVIPVIITILAILAVAGSWYYLVKNKEAFSSGASTQPGSSASVPENWVIHTNTTVGYSVSYPSSYRVRIGYGMGDEDHVINFDQGADEPRDARGVDITIKRLYNPPGSEDLMTASQQEQYIAGMNAYRPNETETRIEPVTIGAIRYGSTFTAKNGDSFDAYYAFAPDGKSKLAVYIWGAENDRENVMGIISSLVPLPTPVLANPPAQVAPPAMSVSPNIDSISPASGPAGTVVTLSGTGFGTASSVAFLENKAGNANPTSVSSTQLKFRVPETLEPGTYHVSVIGSVSSTQGTMPEGNRVEFTVTP